MGSIEWNVCVNTQVEDYCLDKYDKHGHKLNGWCISCSQVIVTKCNAWFSNSWIILNWVSVHEDVFFYAWRPDINLVTSTWFSLCLWTTSWSWARIENATVNTSDSNQFIKKNNASEQQPDAGRKSKIRHCRLWCSRFVLGYDMSFALLLLALVIMTIAMKMNERWKSYDKTYCRVYRETCR